ncbi:MAG: S41 family peptidase [Saprospiraceae bacterium]|nr:S41 family peptidase [Saprospiraceae bacterium]
MRYLLILLLGFSFFNTNAQENPNWLRHQSISPDGSTIVFTYKGDLYTVPSTGGDATQITYHDAHDYKAVWSKDGNTIAFASNRYGNFDIFTMSKNGGQATRLTYHSANEIPFSFSSDDANVIFGAVRQDLAQHRQYPTGAQPEVYSVPVNSGRVNQIFTIPAEGVQVNAQGSQMLYHDKKGYENEWRKHHTSAITRDLWMYDATTQKHQMITSHNAEDRQPIYSEDGNTVYFLSERSGTFNVHKMPLLNPNDVTQLTSFTLHPVRFLSQGGGMLCFGFDGEIYTMKEGQEPTKLSITIRTQDKNNADKYISVGSGINEMAISPDGKEIAFIARGEVFVTSVDKSFTKRVTTTPERERFVTFSHDGNAIIYASERQGRWSIYQSKKVRDEEPFFFASTLLKEEALIENDLDNYLPEMSPDGNKIAYVEGRRTLKVMDLKTKAVVTLLTPDDLFHMRDGDQDFTWSPDSKWLLVDWGKSLNNSDILLMAADGSKRVNLNNSGYYDSSPKWVNGGKQMLWVSNRNGLKSYATSGNSQFDVYTMFFNQEAWDKYNLSEEDFKLLKEIEEAQKEKKKKEEKEAKEKDKDKKKDKKDKKKGKDKDKDKEEDKEKEDEDEVKPITFDWDNMTDRKSRLTIHSSSLGDAVLSKDGETLYYLARFEDKMNLWSTNLRTRETKMAMKLGARFGSLQWDKEMKNLYLLSGGSISKIDPKAGKKKSVKIKSEVPFDRNAERQAMFDHVWIRTNNIFYHSNFHGIDWDLMKTEYGKYLPHIGNSYEFTEMLSEMLGELNVSHAGARYRGGISNGDATASLGIFMDYNHTGNGILIEEIIDGGPLDKANFNIKKGMIIEKIDGETITPDNDVAKYLNRKSGKFTLLEVRDPQTQKTETITMKPISIGAENRLLYKRWVKTNRMEVEKASDGKIGYVHIPGMSDGPYRTIYEEMMGKYFETEGVIVDTRFNGGGDLVADLAMFFTGEPFISYETEQRVVGGEPTSRWTKPTLAMFNESMYSDGHCFACGYSDLKIGKTVGMPVPGTCSFAGWEGLPDGSRWGVVPVSAKDKQGKWMENSQTEPMFKVKNMPGVVDKGRDQQLEKAIEEMKITIQGR